MKNTAPDTSFARTCRICLAALAVLVTLALCPFTCTPAGHIKVFLYSYGAAVLALAAVVAPWFGGPRIRWPRLLSPALLPFTVLCFVASLFSSYVGHSLVESGKFAALLLLYFVAAQYYRSPRHVCGLLAAIVSAVGLSVLYGFVQRAGLDPFPWDTAGLDMPFAEMPGTFGNGNLAAHGSVLALLMAIYLAFTKGRGRWCALLIPLLLAQLYFSNQRGGIVALIAAGALLVAVRLTYGLTKRPAKAVITGSLLVSILAVAAALVLMAGMKARTGVPFPTSQPLLLRYHGYAGAVKLAMARPVLGHGPGTYEIENPRFWTAFEKEHFAVNRMMNTNAHNDAFEVACEAGIPAAGLYVSLLVLGVFYGLIAALSSQEPEKRRLGYLFAAFFCAFLVDGLFGFNLRAPVTAFYLFLMAGAMEGALAPDGPASRSGWRRIATPALAAAMVVTALGVVWAQGRVFASEVLLQRGTGASVVGAYEDADRLLTRGEALASWNWMFARRLGNLALMQGNPDRAIPNFERAVARNPNHTIAWVALARARLELAATGAPAADLSREDAAKWKADLLDQANADAQRALAICDVLPEAEAFLGQIAAERAALIQARVEQPGLGGNAQLDQALTEAAAFYTRALNHRAANRDEIYHMLAGVQLAQGNIVGTEDALMRAVNANPLNAALWPAFAAFAREHGRLDGLRAAVLNASARIKAESLDAPAGLDAMALVWRPDRKPEDLRSATETLARASISVDGTGVPQEAPEQNAWALDLVLAEVLKSDLAEDARAAAIYDLAVANTVAKRWQEADALYDRCWAALPETRQPEAVRNWVVVLDRLGDTEKAIQVLRAALAQGVAEPRLHAVLGHALAKAGRIDEARAEYEAILNAYELTDEDRDFIQARIAALGDPAP